MERAGLGRGCSVGRVVVPGTDAVSELSVTVSTTVCSGTGATVLGLDAVVDVSVDVAVSVSFVVVVFVLLDEYSRRALMFGTAYTADVR